MFMRRSYKTFVPQGPELSRQRQELKTASKKTFFWLRTIMKILPVLAVFFAWIYCTTYTFNFNSWLKPFKRPLGRVSALIFTNKCMEELGCFNNGAPFFDILERPLSLVPSDRESINTHFLLFTRTNPNRTQNFTNLEKSADRILRSAFLPASKIKFIVPGYNSKFARKWEQPLTDALLSVENVNVFVVDWTGGDGPLYEQAVANTRVVGAELAVFIEFLQDVTGIKPEDVHIIGHSLGSHIAGYAGKRVKNIGRITGLDPAGPYFENVAPVVRLSHDDAFLVDIIHTNAAKSRFKGFGTTESIGDLDFFPNGGSHQPGCRDIGDAIWSFLMNPARNEENLKRINCNHHRAIELFFSSVTEKNCEMIGITCRTWEDFLAGKCGSCSGSPKNCAIMGYHADEPWRENGNIGGNFYFETTGSPPFCLHL